MIKASFSFLSTFLLLFVLGCSFDSRYEAEKAYWEARKIDRELHRDNPEGLKEEHYEQIIEALNKVVELAPLDNLAAQAQFQVAQIYLGIGKRELARKTLNSIFLTFSESENKDKSNTKDIASQALFWVGKIHERNGDLEKAEEIYKKLIDRYPLTKRGLEMPIYIMRYYKSRGDIFKMKEATANARSHYESLVNKYEGTSIAETVRRYSLQIYAMEGAWQDVLNFWDTEIDTKLERSEKIRAKISKANILTSKMENIPEAEKIYKNLIDQYPVEPTTPFIKMRLGYLLIAVSKTEEARELFNNIADEYSEVEEFIIQSRFGLAAADYKDGEYEKVFNRFDSIYAEYPESASTIRIPLMKYIYYRQSNRAEDEVEEAFENAMKEYSSRWEKGGSTRSAQTAGRLLFLCLVQKKDWDSAAAHFKSFTKRFPNDPNSLKLAKALYWQGSGNDSSKALQILFDRSNDSPFFQPEESPIEDSPMQDVSETLEGTPEV